MTSKQIVFVQALPLGRSKREQELEQAKARSHAAKVVHRRARDAQRGYQELINAVVGDDGKKTTSALEGHHGEGPIRSEANRSLALRLGQESTDQLASRCDAQSDATSIPFNHRKVVVQGRPMRKALGPTPSYSSLRCGNSDPFGAVAIQIDPRTNALMQYTREFYLPTLARDITNPNAIIRPEDWTECVNLLSDTCTAYAHLTRVAAFMSQRVREDVNVAAVVSQPGHRSADNELTRQTLIFSAKGTALLRERLENGIVDHITLYVMSCFLAAEIYARNFTAARHHAKILGELFPKATGVVDFNLLLSVLRLDSTLAVTCLTRPMLDVETWIPEVFAPYFKPLLETLPASITVETIASKVDGSIINDDHFKDIIVRMRSILPLFVLGMFDPKYAGLEYNFYIKYTLLVNMARFVNHYLDAEEICRTKTVFDSIIMGRAQVQAAVCLAAMLCTRFAATEAAYLMGKKAVAIAEDEMTARLKEKITDSEWVLRERDQGGFANARLSALYIGAQLEHYKAASTLSYGSASRAWFNIRFAHHVNAMGLDSWQQVNERLRHFVDTQGFGPGSRWFSETMEANVL